jgi:hypothetical protein
MSTATVEANSDVNSIGAIVAKALREPELYAQLLANPKQTLLAMQVAIPDNQDVTVLESDGSRSYFVLPMMTDADVQELKDSLSSVQGKRSCRSQILIKVAEDPSYKIQLLETPKPLLKAAGIAISDQVELMVLENSAEHLYIVIPAVHRHHHD